MRRLALVAEYVRWCAPPGSTAGAVVAALWGMRHRPKDAERQLMTREALVKAILDAAETGARRY